MLSWIANVASIVGFVITVFLLIRTEALRKTLVAQRLDYNREQAAIKRQLSALRTNIIEDDLLSRRVVSDMRTKLFEFEQKFEQLLTRKDKGHLSHTLELLNRSIEQIDIDELCKELDYFVARFERREVD